MAREEYLRIYTIESSLKYAKFQIVSLPRTLSIQLLRSGPIGPKTAVNKGHVRLYGILSLNCYHG